MIAADNLAMMPPPLKSTLIAGADAVHFRLIDGHLFETIAEELAAVRRTEAVSCLIVAGRHEHHGSTVLVRKGDGGYAALVDDPTHIDLRRPESARSVDGAVLARAMRAGRAC